MSNIARPPLQLLALVALVMVTACGEDPTTATADTVADTAQSADTATSTDATEDADVDAQDVADGADDDVSDTVAEDAAPTGDATPGCDYLDDRKVAKCHGVWVTVLYWSDWGDASCPTWWQLGTDTVATLDELETELECDVDCVLTAKNAFSFIDCDGHRNGWESYAGADGCGEAYGTADGIYTDLCAWPAYTCHCEEE